MNRRSRALVLLVLGGAVAGWGCALLSRNAQARYETEQRDDRATFDKLLQQFDTQADAQQGTPDFVVMRPMFGLLTQAQELAIRHMWSTAPLLPRQEKLADWGYADSQYWLGKNVDPCVRGGFRYSRGIYLERASRARYWYGKAAAQNMSEAQQALAHLDTCKVPEQ